MAPESKLYRQTIEGAADSFGLDPDLVEAIVRVESSGLTHAYRYEPGFWLRYLASNPEYQGKNPRRVSSSYGLMQVMWPTARARGCAGEPEQLFVPLCGLYWGCKHLEYLLTLFGGDQDKAIAAYNVGEGTVQQHGIVGAGAVYLNKVKTALAAVKEGQ